MLNVLYVQLTYASTRAKQSAERPLENVAEEALIGLVDLCGESLFCALLLQEENIRILDKVMDIAINHRACVRYYCCMIFNKLLASGESEMEDTTTKPNLEVLYEFLRSPSKSDQTEALIVALVEECAVGKYYEVHTRVAAGELIKNLASSKIFDKDSDAARILGYNLSVLRRALLEDSRPEYEKEQIEDYNSFFDEARQRLVMNDM